MSTMKIKALTIVVAASALARFAHAEDVCTGLAQVAPGAQPAALNCIDASAKTAYDNALNTYTNTSTKFVDVANKTRNDQANTDQQSGANKNAQSAVQTGIGGAVSTGPVAVANPIIGGGPFSMTKTGDATMSQDVKVLGSNTGYIGVNGLQNTGGTLNTGVQAGNYGLTGGGVTQNSGQSSGQTLGQNKSASQVNSAPTNNLTK